MESLLQPTVYPVLKHAVGTIQADDSQQKKLDEFCGRIASGEFYRPTDVAIVCDCVDGRCASATDPHDLRPNAAGGSESLMVADDLTGKRFAFGNDGSTLEQYQAMLAFMRRTNHPVGGHTCEGVSAPASGCGANDKLAAIYSFMRTNGRVLRDLTASLGIEVDNATHNLIIANARERDHFSVGAELLDALEHDDDAQARTSHLTGSHREVAAAINIIPGTTLDRDALKAEYPDHQVFNVDAWAFDASARLLTEDEDEIAQLVAALAYYNLATAHVLGGPRLRVIVVK